MAEDQEPLPTHIDGYETEMLKVALPPHAKRWLREVAHQRKQAGETVMTTMSDIVAMAVDRLMYSVWRSVQDIPPEFAARTSFTPLVKELADAATSIPLEAYSAHYSGADSGGES